jgi:hypothetical protein
LPSTHGACSGRHNGRARSPYNEPVLENLLWPSPNRLLIFSRFPLGPKMSVWIPPALVSSCLALSPLAGLLGQATEHIVSCAGEGLCGFLKATLGNGRGTDYLIDEEYSDTRICCWCDLNSPSRFPIC